jgi:uncharacterized membrane protein AbrB (regulator of aidB expression)
VLAVFLPIASISVATFLRHGPNSPSVASTLHQVGVSALFAIGVLEVPFGLLSGWLFWRTAVPGTVTSSGHVKTQQYRYWQDIGKRQLVVALMLAASVLWAVLVFTGLLLGDGPSNPTFSVSGLGGALISLEIWSLGLGLLYLFTICRRRGTVSRRDCLLMGTLLTCCFPVCAGVAAFLMGVSLDTGDGDGLLRQFVTFAAVGIMLIPCGLLSGWILWRFGVRPAPEPFTEVAGVFE